MAYGSNEKESAATPVAHPVSNVTYAGNDQPDPPQFQNVDEVASRMLETGPFGFVTEDAMTTRVVA